MAKNYSKFKKTKKSLIALLAAAAVTCTGLAAACGSGNDDTDEDTAPKKEDTQLLKNGDFEFFTTPSEDDVTDGKAAYLIKTPTSGTWTSGGESSNAMSGIISTSESAWAALTDENLAGNLSYNADLDSDDDGYVDYNGMKARDVMYKDTYAALLAANKIKDDDVINAQGYEKYFGIEERDGKYYIGETQVYRNGDKGEYYFGEIVKNEDDENYYIGDTLVYLNEEDGEYYRDPAYSVCMSIRTQLIANPLSHYTVTKGEDDALTTVINGVTYDVYEDVNGSYYYYTDNTESDDIEDKNFFSNVLMVHNYPTDSNYNGIHQYYTSQSITLEANTAAEISVWVKTSDLKFSKGYSQLTDEDRGAYIEVVQTVGGNALDSFVIKSINTEKILADDAAKGLSTDVTANGWIKYTVYVEACDFAQSTVQLRLGLGRSDNYEKLTGYAFFDDVQIKKYVSLTDEGCTYTANRAKLTENTTYTLTSEDDEKVFVADKALTSRNMGRYTDEYRNSKDFHYLINLTSASADTKTVAFGSNVTAGLTTEKSSTGYVYASAKELSTDVKTAGGIALQYKNGESEYKLPSGLKNQIITSSDLLGSFGVNEKQFAGSSYSNMLSEALTTDSTKLPGYDGDMLVMLSRYGAAYTSRVTGGAEGAFTLDGGEHMILSFWVKTSDMKGKAAATLKIVDVADSKKNATFTLDTTDKTTNVGDSKDIYNGWVQCFFFVANDTTVSKEFNVEFCFGNTGLISTTLDSYNYGWVALANMQALKVDEDVYNLTSAGDYSQKFAFSAEDEKDDGLAIDSASGTSDIKNGVVNAASYDGVNGASSTVEGSSYRENYDGKNTNYVTDEHGVVTRYAGLINKSYFSNYGNWNDIYTAFGGGGSAVDAVAAWEEVFGTTCYQPLIIINNLRAYVEKAEDEVTAENYKNYFVEAEDDYSGAEVTFAANGKTYRKVAEGEEYNENTEYYSQSDILNVANYGFVSTSKTVSSSSYETVSVKVKVSGEATAYIYLVDASTRKVLSYSTPAYTYNYDDEGNVLNTEFEGLTEAEHKAAIVYTLRADGLYDGKDGKVYANLGNLKKLYKYSENENKDFYNEGGENVSYDNLQTLSFGEKYYSNSDKTTEAAHYIVNSKNKRLYEFKDGKYYYIVDGETSATEVENFDTQYVRYATESAQCGEYKVAITADNAAADENGWVTVNFFIHTGDDALEYRLELWSGERDSTGVENGNEYKEGAVAFDYSMVSISESEYAGMLEDYQKQIVDEYKTALRGNIPEDDIDKADIAYYEKLAEKLIANGTIEESKTAAIRQMYGEAKYYAYTLYDSAAYVPFNSETAEDGETGYDYTVSDDISAEKLAYFTYVEEDLNMINVFADYSAVSQNVTMNTVNDNDNDTDSDDGGNAGEFALLISSIVLLVVLLFTMLSILLRDVFKKRRRKKGEKALSKNNYRRRQRYIRKLHLSTENAEEPEDNAAEESGADETPDEEVNEVEPAAEVNAEEPATEPENGAEAEKNAPASASESAPEEGAEQAETDATEEKPEAEAEKPEADGEQK